ncbi:Six-hairpin glycosidase-like protein [Hygrophoropsis aurantiaca]|uniref:Six-hairpin glycosidase-like protein n=1 Tax=Hygrophoropsis aurantiaca TaxID=72124 RepID=A0ACB8ABM1_9AGAM|nr:Six-hairpin glycosidase-like protein [Hygrophoropsis aurantiaca]
MMFCLELLTIVLFLSWAYGQNLTNAQISVVSSCLASGASHSWEYGTRAEALLELNAPSYSVLSSSHVPPPPEVPSNLTAALNDVFSIARMVVSNRSISNGNIIGPQPLIQDASAADPASIGIAVILANWTGQGNIDDLDYAGAAQDQLDFLFTDVPKTSDGALSHRVDQVQLWSDFVYMVPPFLAYYGVVSNNKSLLVEAYTQISLYRKYLRDTHSNNLWKHVLLGSSDNDEGHWATGNAWAAAGMIRVLGTIQRSQYANQLKGQQKDLANWVREIHGGMYPLLNYNGLFRNYPDDDSTFYDASSTALLASTVYRLSLLWNTHTYLPLAEQCRKAISAPLGAQISVVTTPSKSTSTSSTPTTTSISPPPTSATSNMLHFTPDGWLTPVVNPYSYGSEGQNSPEGQAFVLEMQAAWRDWVADGAKGANGSYKRFSISVSLLWTIVVAHGVCTWLW